MATTKISSMDQRPTNSTIRYIFVRCRGSQVEYRCTEMNSNVRARSFALGTRMLAINTMTAKCQDPDVQR